MIRESKWKILISSIVIVLPIVFGLIFWDKLPEQMPTHWGIDGTVDGWSGRAFAVFGLPLFVLAVHWLCIFCTGLDPKNKGQNGKMFGLVLWITPVVSLVANGMVYAAAFWKTVVPNFFANFLIGMTFIIIGNYLPKCKQNHTIGIKVKWTLESEENWNATHRFGGKIWVAGGVVLVVSGVLPDVISVGVVLACVVILAVMPMVYSYRYHKKHSAGA